MNIKNLFGNIKTHLSSLYTSGTTASHIAIGATALTGLAVVTIGSIFLISAFTNGTSDETSGTTAAIVTEQEITTAPTEELTTAIIESSSQEETTTEETTTEVTTTEEATTEEATTEEVTTVKATEAPTPKPTVPPTIAVEDLNIGSKDEEATAETAPPPKQDFFYEDELETKAPTTTVAPTTKPADKTTQATTKPADKTTQATTKPADKTTQATTKPADKTTQATTKPADKATQATTKPTESTTEPTTKPTVEIPIEPPTGEFACAIKGIDISKWNSQGKTPIDWKKVKNSGVEYVFIRAGYRGQTSAKMYEDPCFKEHIEGALSAGLQVGVYFYSQAINEQEALEEASFLLSIIKDYKLTYPVCFDWEPVAGSRAKDANLTKAQASAVARKFLSTMEGYGYETMLYSYHSAIKTYFNADLLNEFNVWMAYYFKSYANTGVEYKTGDNLPDTTYPYQIWQYSSTGKVPGIQGDVDMNVSFISYDKNGNPVSGVTIIPPAQSFTTNAGEAIDYQTGIWAFSSVNTDITSSVKVAIKNSKGKNVSEDVAFNTPGKYTIVYSAKDFTNITKTVKIPLTVRRQPRFAVTKDTLTFNINTVTTEDILKALTENIVTIKDNEGNLIDTSLVTYENLEALESLNAGEYTITYWITDSNNLTGTCSVTVILTDTVTEEATSKNDASKETTSKNDSSKETTSKNNSSKETTSKNNSSKETTSKNNSSKETTSKNNSSKETTSKNNSSKEATSKNNNSEEATTKNNK